MLNFGEAVVTPTVTSAGMREGRAAHDRMDAGGRAAPGAAAEEQLPEILTYSVYAPFLISILPCTASLHGDLEQALS